MFQSLFLIQRSFNSPSIQRKKMSWTYLFPNKSAPYMPLDCPREPPSLHMESKKYRCSEYDFFLDETAPYLPLSCPREPPREK